LTFFAPIQKDEARQDCLYYLFLCLSPKPLPESIFETFALSTVFITIRCDEMFRRSISLSRLPAESAISGPAVDYQALRYRVNCSARQRHRNCPQNCSYRLPPFRQIVALCELFPKPVPAVLHNVNGIRN